MSDLQSGIAENRAWAPTGRELEIVCNLCSSQRTSLVAIENGYNVVTCEGCGLIYVNPQPTEADLAQFYSQYFPEESGDIWSEMMRSNFDLDSQHMLRQFSVAGNALDIGCGYGAFLRRFADAGWGAKGLDFSPAAVAEANRHPGIDVRQGAFVAGMYPPESFDIVTAWYVLEHARDPVEFVKEVFTVLKPGGMFGMRVPNMVFSKLFLMLKQIPGLHKLLFALNIDTDNKSSHFNIIDPPAHLFGFKPATINKLLAQAGFDAISIVPAQPVQVGTAGTLLAKKVLYGSTSIISDLTGHRFNPAPAVTAFARKLP